ncbi:hypothetical protein B0J17DRAFT_646890 [Rhizoctonia solani]|nr:hypothetical protein B0J17DRAFT_646890 [Rhizoctonia solani]
MIVVIRYFDLIVSICFIWLAALSFFVHSLSTSVSKHSIETSDPQTYNPAPDSNIVQPFHGPVNIHGYHTYYPEQLGFFVWAACLLGASLFGFVLGYRYKSTPEPSVKLENGCTCHKVGRTPAIASGRPLERSDGPSEPEVSSSAPGASSARSQRGRGKQLPSQGLSVCRTPPRAPWEVKEAYTDPFGKDQMPSLSTALIGLQIEEKNDSKNWGPIPIFGSRANEALLSSIVKARLSPIQAPSPTDTNDHISLARPKRAKTKPKGRPIQVPHPGSVDSTHRRHRGSTPSAVETLQVKRKSSLENTLFGNPHVDPEPIVWFILIVAVDYPDHDVRDPKHDLDFWKKMLDDPALASENIRLVVLAGKDATPESIKESLTRLYRESEALGTGVFPNLFVYLTGEGDADWNKMHLLGGQFVSEEDIDQWLRELHTAHGHAMPISLVIDICRMNKDKPSAKMHHGVGLIYSTSPGEKAHALQFKSEQEAPYSSFMLALVVASSDSPESTSAEFVAAVEQRLDQLTGFIRTFASKRGDKDPGHQQPDWSQAGDLSPFLRLARILSRTTAAREAHAFITQMPYFREEDTASSSTPKYNPSPTDRTAHHLRGASNRVPVMGP